MIQDILNKFTKTKTSKFINEELVYKFYEQVSKDIRSGIKEEGVWAKAFTFADGDEQKTKAKYIEFMVERLMLAYEAENELLEKNAKENHERQKIAEKIRRKREIDEEYKHQDEFLDSFLGIFISVIIIIASIYPAAAVTYFLFGMPYDFDFTLFSFIIFCLMVMLIGGIIWAVIFAIWDKLRDRKKKIDE